MRKGKQKMLSPKCKKRYICNKDILSMKIAISGSGGFIGKNITKMFSQRRFEVIPLLRNDFSLNDEKLAEKISSCEVVINLAGAPILGRWTQKYRNTLYNSRIETTRKLVSALENSTTKPSLFISASAVGIYDDLQIYTEKNIRVADDFLAKICSDWEVEAQKASAICRTVIFRFGVVLDRHEGAFPRMLRPFVLGLGGKIGNGKQGFSWIHLQDILKAFDFAIENKEISGIYNLVSPKPITNKELTEILGNTLSCPVFLTVPAFALKLIYGKGAIVLLHGQKILPQRLLESGFVFNYPSIETALEELFSCSHCTGKSK